MPFPKPPDGYKWIPVEESQSSLPPAPEGFKWIPADDEQPREIASIPEEIGKGLKAGVQQIRGMGYGLGALVGEATDIDPLKAWSSEGLADVEKKTPLPTTPSYADVTDISDLGRYLAYGIASNAPNLALSLAGGGIGGVTGRIAIRKAAEEAVKTALKQGATKEVALAAGKNLIDKAIEKGAVIGAGASSIGMETGSIASDQLQETGKADPLRALAGGIPAGLLDIVPEWYLAKKLGWIGKGAKEFTGNRLTRAGKVAGQQFAMEAPTEAMQSVIERTAVPGKSISNAEAWDEYINSFILGGATGGLLGGAGGMFTKASPKQLPPSTPPIDGTEPIQPGQPPPGEPPPSGGQGGPTFNGFEDFAGAYQDGATYDDLKGKRDEYSKRPDADPNVLSDVDTFLNELKAEQPSGIDEKISELKAIREANGITDEDLITSAGQLMTQFPNEKDKVKSAFPDIPFTLNDALKKSETVTPFTDEADALNKSIIENLPALKANDKEVNNGPLQTETEVKAQPNSLNVHPLVSEMVQTAQKSLDELRQQVTNVRYGNPGEILFEFQGKTYTAPEPTDVMPVGQGEASQSWALKQVLSGTATATPAADLAAQGSTEGKESAVGALSTPEAKAYIKEQQDKANYNYVIFDESDIEVTAKFQRRGLNTWNTLPIDDTLRNHWKKKVEEQYEHDRDTEQNTTTGGRVANDSRNIGDEQLSLPSGEELGRLLERQIQKTRGKTESRWLESAVLDLSIRDTTEFRVANQYFSSFGYTVIPIGKVEWLGLVNHTDKIALVSHLTGDSFSYFMSHEISHILSNQGNSAISAIKENLNTQHPDFVTINNILGMGEEFTREEIAASLVGGWDRYKHLLTGKDSDKSIQDARKAVIDSATKEPKTKFQRQEKEAFEQASEPTPPEYDLGDLESKRKEIEDYVKRARRSIEMPEMVALAKDLLGGKFPLIREKLRSAFGNSALGKFIPQGDGNILLKAGIFSDIQTASKVLAHEIGHLVDFLPDHTMKRGNILGRIASLHHYMKNYLEEFKGAPGLLTDEDRKRLHKEAREQIKSEEKPDEVIVEEIIKEIPQYEYTGITPEIILDLMKGRVEGKIAPELYEYLQRAETKEKKQIVLKALKDMVDERVAQFGSKKQVGTETVRETVERVIPGVKYDQETIYKRFKELLQKEVDKRVLYRREVISDELKKLTKLWSPFDDSMDSLYRKYRWSSKELYADAFSVFINYPELMQKEAPTFHKAFLSWIESKPEVKETYDAYQKLANDREAVQERREKYFYEMQKGHKTKEQEVMEQIEAERKISPRNILRELYKGLIDRNLALMEAVKKLKKAGKVTAANSLEYFKEERNYLASEADFYLEEVKQKIIDPLEKAGFNEDDLGYLGTLMRTATQRRDVANPGGMGGYFSDEQIEHLKNKLGTERFNTLKGLLEKFSDLRQDVVIPKLEEAGMYSEALLNTMKTEKNYLTFNVTKFLDKMYGGLAQSALGKVYHTIGTFQDIQNPFIATIFKDISLMRAAEITKYKKELRKAFSENEELQDQIQPAEKKFNGTVQVFAEPKDPKMGMVTYLNNGKVEAFYITKEIADDFNNKPVEAMHILKFFNAIMMPVKAMLVNRNPIWMFRNVVRDYLGTAQNIPGATVTNLLPYYRKAFMDAWGEVMQGKKLDVVQQMKKGKMLVIDRQYHLSDDMSDDTEFDKLYAKFGHYGEKKRHSLIEPFAKAWDFLGDLGKVSERAGKVAGYRWMKENTDMTEREIGHVVRSRIGTPDVYRRGAWQLVTNNMFLYSNVGKEGFRSSWESFQDNKAAFAWKMVKYNFLPKAVLALAALGAFGDDAEDILKRISNYDKANYLVVPFYKTSEGKAVYLRMPQSYMGQFWGAIAWDLFNLEFKKAIETVASDQPYSFNPVIKAALNWGLYAMDTNPQDWYRGQNIVNRKEWDAGEPYRLMEMSKNTWNSLGGTLLWKFNKGQDPKGVWEQISSLPGLNILGSFLKESNQGLKEEYNEASALSKRDSAIKSMSKDERIAKRERIKRQLSDAKSLYKKGYINRKMYEERVNTLHKALEN